MRQHRLNPTTEIEYRHFDHLGSSASITDSAGSELVSLAHDPHGERRRPDWTRRLSDAETGALASDHPDRTSRGFTGTSIWTGPGLVHMNGRLYDPLAGPVPEPGPDRREPGRRPAVEPVQLRDEQPAELHRPERADDMRPGLRVPAERGGMPGAGRGGYGTRTVSGWGTYVTFGIYHRIVRIWRGSSSFNSWGAGAHDGGWSDDTHWEDVQQSVIEPIFHIVRWVLQVVEQSAAAEPASSHSPERIMVTVLGHPDRDRQDPALQAVNRRTFPSPEDILANYPNPLGEYCEQADPNECAVRMSMALHGAGVDISTGPKMKGPTHLHPGGVTIQMGARVLADYLWGALGPPQRLGRSEPWTIEDFGNRQGIIYLPNAQRGGDALTEHIDVISGGVAGSDFYPNIMVWFWEYEDGKYVDPR